MRKSATTSNGKVVASTDIMDAIHEKSAIPTRDIRDVMRAVFKEIEEALARGSRVVICDFGSFSVRIRKGRTAMLTNMHDGSKFQCVMPAVPVLKFTAGKQAKDRLKAGYKIPAK